MKRYRTTLSRAFPALAVAALLAGLANAASDAVLSYIARHHWVPLRLLVRTVGDTTLFVAVLGGAAWLLLHWLGRRSWLSALITGAGLGLLVSGYVWIWTMMQMAKALHYDLADTIQRDLGVVPLLLGVPTVAGALLALIAWRMAYRREAEPAAAF